MPNANRTADVTTGTAMNLVNLSLVRCPSNVSGPSVASGGGAYRIPIVPPDFQAPSSRAAQEGAKS